MSQNEQELQQRAQSGASFSERIEARSRLHYRGLGSDPWEPQALAAELDRVAQAGAAPALAEAGRALLAAESADGGRRLAESTRAKNGVDREAIAVVRGLLALRDGAIPEAIATVERVPHPEAVAVHGLALMQLGEIAQAAARLEVLLAADALNEEGELPATYLPGPTPVLELFGAVCVRTARAHLRAGRRDEALRHASAVRDALRRYPTSQLDPQVAADLKALLEETAKQG